MGRMLFFVKFYEEARYAADFIEGRLFCKTVAEIKDLEEKTSTQSTRYWDLFKKGAN